MKFDVIIIEKCITSCASQQTYTQLKASVKNEISESIADGSFLQTLMNETTVALSKNGTLLNDNLLSVVDNLNGTVGAATVTVTISASVTTSAPTNAPTSIPATAPTRRPATSRNNRCQPAREAGLTADLNRIWLLVRRNLG